MTTSPAAQSVPVSTFTTARIAARPRVIPLYATAIPRRARHTLFLHHNLAATPYVRPRINIPPIEIPSSSTSLSREPEPESPLTPVQSEGPPSGDTIPEYRPIFVPRPANVTVLSAGWAEDAIPHYRQIARQAVNQHFNIQKSFTAQGKLQKAKARDHIVSAIPFFKAHEDHWGADLLLKDQLKSKKDTRTKAETRAKGRNSG